MPAAASIRHCSNCCIVCGLPLSYIRYLMQPQSKKSNGFKLVGPSYPATPVDYSTKNSRLRDSRRQRGSHSANTADRHYYESDRKFNRHVATKTGGAPAQKIVTLNTMVLDLAFCDSFQI